MAHTACLRTFEAKSLDQGLNRRHAERGMDAVAGDIANHSQAAVILKFEPLKQIPADFIHRFIEIAGRICFAGKTPVWQHHLLHLACKREIFVNAALQHSHIINTLIVGQSQSDDLEKRLLGEGFIQIVRMLIPGDPA